MKRRDLIKQLELEAKACGLDFLLTEGSRHTHVQFGKFRTEVPRHTEVSERLAQAILKKARETQ